jgi:hypothetical protein
MGLACPLFSHKQPAKSITIGFWLGKGCYISLVIALVGIMTSVMTFTGKISGLKAASLHAQYFCEAVDFGDFYFR